MSQLKVSSIVDTAGGNTVTINGATPTTYNTMGKNRIINGDMRIDQRNAGASVTPAAPNQYTLDRWKADISVSSKYSAQQSSTVPTGFVNSLLITSLSAYTVGSAERFCMTQNIEGLNVPDLGWGSASAKTVTLSFWVRSSLTGTFGGAISNSAQNRSYPFSYSISAANTWEQKTVTITGDTSGTWLTTSGIGLRVIWGLGVGSTLSTTAGAWAAGEYYSATGATSVVGTNGATWYITGVQLEVGSVASEFERRPYGTELALCQRYFWQISTGGGAVGNYHRFAIGSCTGGAGNDGILQLPVRMRIAPSLTTTGTASDYAAYSGGTVRACSSEPTLQNNTTWEVLVVSYAVASGQTQGFGSQLISNNNQTSYFKLSAEL
jgi:hypothetical protein